MTSTDRLPIAPARALLTLALALVMARSIWWLIARLPLFGHNIPQPNIVGDYVRGFAWALFLWAVIALLPLAERSALIVIWPIKVAVTLGAMLFYEQHYGLDAYAYFNWATTGGNGLGFAAQNHSVQATIVAAVLTGASYHAIKIIFSFVGLAACLAFYRACCHFFRSRDLRILYAIALLPSILFWSSILGKDPINFLGVALYALGVCGLVRNGRAQYLLLVVLGVAIAAYARPWFIVIMTPPALWVACLHVRGTFQRFGVVIVGVAVMASAFSLSSNLPLPHSLGDAVTLVNVAIEGQAAPENNGLVTGSGQRHTVNTPMDLIRFFPAGAFTALYRPLPWEARNPFSALAALENVFLLLLTFSALLHWRHLVLRDGLVQWAIAFVFSWLMFYAYVSYGNLGAAVRFRLQVLPVFWLLVLLLGTARGRQYLSTLSDSVARGAA